MCSLTDSGATYCSEVEEMLAACNIPLNKSSNSLPLRRSQRLSQKYKITYENIKNIAAKAVPAASGVPLDLSYKSKESTVETPGLVISEAFTAKNVLGVVKTNDRVIARPQKLKYKNTMLKKEVFNTQRNASDNKYTSQLQQRPKRDHTKKVDNAKNILSQNNALDLVTFPKLNLLQNNKLEEKTLRSNKCFAHKGRHPKKSRPGRTNSKTFAKSSCNGVASIETTEAIQLSEVIKYKPIEMNLSEKYTNEPSKRGRKRKHNFGEIALRSNTDSNTKQNAHHNHVKFLVDTNGKTPAVGADFHTKKSTKTKIKQNARKSDKRQVIYTTSNEIKPKRMLQRQSSLTKKKLSGQNVAVNNLHNKIKTEQLSQKSYEEGIQANNSLQGMSSAAASKVCSQFIETKLDTIEVKHEHQNDKSPSKLSKEIDKAEKTLNDTQKVERKTDNFQKDIQPKNYIKAFDKNQFLDKIRNARSYGEYLSVGNNNLIKTNTFETPPSAAESSEELLKNAILFKAYPPHFKHQLPPEAIITTSLDPQPLPTPDDTISSELLDSSSSSPSLPESICELFKTKDIKDILNLKRTSYRLNSYHIQALALILNLQIDYLLKILDKVVNTSPAVLKNIEKAVKTPFVPDNDLFSNSSNELWDISNIVVPNSQSPKPRIISCSMK